MKYCSACHRTYPADYNVCPTDQTVLQASREFHPGLIIRNKYEVLDLLAVGGMGLVYRARHLTFNELCAIKVVSDDIAGDPNFLRRFQTEATVMRRLRHPNAVRVEDFDYTDDGRPFIVMELVEGKSISQTLEEEGPLGVARAVRVATQVARVIGVAHKLGIVHRDIKPSNLILTTDDRGQEMVKVLDFGIAKLREAAGEARPEMTMTGMMMGTPYYMSPEQFMGKKAGEEIDGRTDIYSLGVVLYQMITAQLPFVGDTLYSLMQSHLKGDVRPPDEVKPELRIPKPLSQVILKAMEKSREQRFQTAEDFGAALDQMTKNEAANGVTPALAETLEGSKTAARQEPGLETNVTTGRFRLSTRAGEQIRQGRRFGLKHLVAIIALGLVAVLVGGVGYPKYQSARRMRILNVIDEKLKAAPSPSLRRAGVRVFVSAAREVTLDGNVQNSEDFAMAESLAASVPGVIRVTNRLTVVESPESLINKGITLMDSGDYPSAIDCFQKASADPDASNRAKEWLVRAERAQQTEAKLLRKRQ